MNKLLSFLGIARRAGSLTLGFEAVKSAAIARKAFLILAAADLSERTRRELKKICVQNNIAYRRINTDIFSVTQAVGFKSGCIAVCDEGFAKRIKSMLNEQKELSDSEEECTC